MKYYNSSLSEAKKLLHIFVCIKKNLKILVETTFKFKSAYVPNKTKEPKIDLNRMFCVTLKCSVTGKQKQIRNQMKKKITKTTIKTRN